MKSRVTKKTISPALPRHAAYQESGDEMSRYQRMMKAFFEPRRVYISRLDRAGSDLAFELHGASTLPFVPQSGETLNNVTQQNFEASLIETLAGSDQLAFVD